MHINKLFTRLTSHALVKIENSKKIKIQKSNKFPTPSLLSKDL